MFHGKNNHAMAQWSHSCCDCLSELWIDLDAQRYILHGLAEEFSLSDTTIFLLSKVEASLCEQLDKVQKALIAYEQLNTI